MDVFVRMANQITFRELSPSPAADCCCASKEIHLVLRNVRRHYRLHNDPPIFSILSPLNPVYVFEPLILWSVVMSSFHLLLGFPGGFFPSCFSPKSLFKSSPLTLLKCNILRIYLKKPLTVGIYTHILGTKTLYNVGYKYIYIYIYIRTACPG